MAAETIYLGGGCFWCTEAVFDRVRGIVDVESGYANGHLDHPSYDDICTGQTGHAEVVKLDFDPAVISLRDVLLIFFGTHDPTTLNRQGSDVGTQYRSAIFTTDAQQTAEAQALMQEMQNEKAFDAPMVTQIEPLTNYWPAEDYHQDYFLQHPGQGYCAFVVGPKVQKFQKAFSRWLKD
ncbi:peptide-methionine (S)-S-oxide reductase MsrA [Comamonas thiooxydans]|uniref:peptide-methionine (S)-S-oxide reductase MsrA n=1 Tax=Comamonas thiooxydans TaxID=363952 RepID=UPI0001BB1576|nr:peptide-methionine (S)-S-oxide reductase MsrA [Comamonas thiooxydans]ACY33032.1 peptide methionine sulfoxide reductase [Comamonas thiooxydans]MDO1475252.1 peptide-methionine (S)-S-oxide reductase MsrA [Comamonas thiooxydans]